MSRPLCFAAVAVAGIWLSHFLLTFRYGLEGYFDRPATAYLWIISGMLLGALPCVFLHYSGIRAPHWSRLPDLAVRWSAWILLMILLVVGIFSRTRHLADYPLNPLHGDMLPLIVSACRHLQEGCMPYAVHQVPWDLTMTFLPGLWLPYFPAVCMGWDPRWIGVLALAVAVLGTIVVGWRWRGPGAIMALAAWMPFCISAAWVDFTIQGHTQIIWLYASALAWGVLQGNMRVVALSTGLLVASRQTMLISILPVCCWIYHQAGFRALLRAFGWMTIPIALLIGPFVWIDFDAVLLAPLRHYHELAEYEWGRGASGHLAQTPGYTYWLLSHGWSNAPSILSAVVMLLTGVGAYYYGRTAAGLLAGLGLGSMLFNAFTPIPWFYIYAPSLIWLGMSMIAWSNSNSQTSVRAGAA